MFVVLPLKSLDIQWVNDDSIFMLLCEHLQLKDQTAPEPLSGAKVKWQKKYLLQLIIAFLPPFILLI